MRSGEAVAVEGVPCALVALIAVIDAEQARRPSAERRERRGRPCLHHVRRAQRGHGERSSPRT